MLAYAAMMTGQRDLAVGHIRAMVKEIPEDVLKEYAMFGEGFMAMPYEVMIRFGMWDDILAEADHPDFMAFTRAFRHAARGIAYAAKGDSKAARTEQAAYVEASRLVPDTNLFGNTSYHAFTTIFTSIHHDHIRLR